MKTTEETRKFCVSQVKRLSGMAFYPTTTEGQRSLVDMLERCATSTEHAERVILSILEESERCPAPADVVNYCRTIPADPALFRPVIPPACPECIPFEGLGRMRAENVLEPCSCARGKMLEKLHQVRKAAAGAAPGMRRISRDDFTPPEAA
jgi:hypothetical protein